MRKQRLFKTAVFRGEMVSIVDAFFLTDETWTFKIKMTDGFCLFVKEHQLSRFCL